MYLGLPLGANTNIIFTWTSDLELSLEAQVCLIKSVLVFLPIYYVP
jgi:hypothetical protein